MFTNSHRDTPYGIGPDSPLFQSNPEKRKPIKKRIFEPDVELRSQSKRFKVEKPPMPQPDLETLLALERRWQAVVEFKVLKAMGMSTNSLVDEIADRYDLGTGRNVRIIVEKTEKRKSLLRKEGSGRIPYVSTRVDVQEFFAAQAVEWEYSFTFEAMAIALKQNLGLGSTNTVKAIMEHLEYRKARRIVRPFLTPDHQAARLAWANRWIEYDFFGSDTIVLHLDEKCFYAFDARGKIVYLPPGVDPEPLYALSKTQIPYD